MKNSLRQIIPFALVGSIGFAVDGGVLTLLTSLAKFNVYSARFCSFILACLVTWLLNRRFTFAAKKDTKKTREYSRYMFIQVSGALANLGIFWLVLQAHPSLYSAPIFPLALGAVAGLSVNYLGSKTWVFR